MSQRLQLEVNGQPVDAQVEPAKLLLDFLRDDLGLTGTKEGCGTGDCGACTVQVNGKPMHSCLTLALEATPSAGNAASTARRAGRALFARRASAGFGSVAPAADDSSNNFHGATPV
jgi:aerobic-type carbon monoxide dehydrogenase small subunit (CoxS/CutS family)